MDFAGFCDEAVRAFLLRGRDALFFVLLYAAGGLLRSGWRVGRGDSPAVHTMPLV